MKRATGSGAFRSRNFAYELLLPLQRHFFGVRPATTK